MISLGLGVGLNRGSGKRNSGSGAGVGDETPPTVLASMVNAAGDKLSLVFDETVTWGSSGAIAGLVLDASGGPVTLSGATLATTDLANDTIEYDLSRIFGEAETALLDYSNPGAGIRDVAGNLLAGFADAAVLNFSTQSVAPVLLSAITNAAGDQIDLTFSAAITYGVGGYDVFALSTDYIAPLVASPATGWDTATISIPVNRRISPLETVTLDLTNVADGVAAVSDGTLVEDIADAEVSILTETPTATFPTTAGGLEPLNEWRYKIRRTIPAENNTIAGVGGYHVCILRSTDNGLPAEFVDEVTADGSDVRVRSSGGGVAYVHHVFKIDQTTGDCVLVIEVPDATAGVAISFDVYFGRVGQTTTSTTTVWQRDNSGGTFEQKFLGWLFDAGKASSKYLGHFNTFTEGGTGSPTAGGLTPVSGAQFVKANSQRLEWATGSPTGFGPIVTHYLDTAWLRIPASVPGVGDSQYIDMSAESNGVAGSEWSWAIRNDGAGVMQLIANRGGGALYYWPIPVELHGLEVQLDRYLAYNAGLGNSISANFATVTVRLTTLARATTTLDSSTPGAGYTGTLGTNSAFGGEINISCRQSSGTPGTFGDLAIAYRRCRGNVALSNFDPAMEVGLLTQMGSYSALTVYLNEEFADPPSGYPVTYTVAADAYVGVGIFKDGVMVRQLEGNVLKLAGEHQTFWNGKNDLGADVADPGDCTAEAWEHKIPVDLDDMWDDGVGNTSDLRIVTDFAASKLSRWRSFEMPWDIVHLASGKAYCALGFNEKDTQMARIQNVATTYQRMSWTDTDNYTESLQLVDSDGTRVWAVSNRTPFKVSETVAAERIYVRGWLSDGASGQFDSKHFFSGGAYSCARSFPQFPNTEEDQPDYTPGLGFIRGMCVQRSGDFLFVTREATSDLEVYDKIDGGATALFTVALGGSCLIQTDPTTDDVIALRVTVGAQELLRISDLDTTPVVTVIGSTSFTRPLRFDVDPTGAFVVVADGHPIHQLFALSLADATAYTAWGTSGVYGVAGGYDNGDASAALVTNDKLMFQTRQDLRFWLHRAFVRFDGSGRAWVGDPGNGRILILDEDGVYEDWIGWVPCFYTAAVDKNAPSNWSANWLGYEVTHSPTETSAHAAGWSLTHNYSAGLSESDWRNGANGIVHQHTITRGAETRRYAQIQRNNVTWGTRIFELLDTGIRYTGVSFPGQSCFHSDGCVRRYVVNSGGGYTQIMERTLDSIDGSGNPVFSAEAEACRIPHGALEPAYVGQFVSLDGITPFEETSDGRFVSTDPYQYAPYDYSYTTGIGVNGKYHLGVIARGGSAYLSRASHSGVYIPDLDVSTPVRDRGDPRQSGLHGQFDDVNSFTYGGNRVLVAGVSIDGHDLVVECEHLEFWTGNQGNQYKLRLSNGMFLLQTGRATKGAPYSMSAGNAFSGTCYIDPEDANSLLIVVNDENSNAQLSRFRIPDLDTINRIYSGPLGEYVPPV